MAPGRRDQDTAAAAAAAGDSKPTMPEVDSAPDLQILGDEITLQPSGFTQPAAEPGRGKGRSGSSDDDRALMGHVASFRTEPLQFLREVSLHVSGSGWRAYDRVVGQPILYAGFTDEVRAVALAAPGLVACLAQLAERRLAVETAAFEKSPTEHDAAAVAAWRTRRRAELERGLAQVADRLLDGMMCRLDSRTFMRGAYYVVSQLVLRAYHQGIHVSSEEVLRLMAVAEGAARRRQSLVFLPCHRSHVDYVSLQLICYRLGLAVPVVVAGDNLNLPGLGAMLQRVGAMWIRRAFGDDAVYGAVARAYVEALLRRGHNIECFLEGGRSRTGKLRPPRLGFLGWVLDAVLAGRVEDVVICPVSTQYDKVIETHGYATELLGSPKRRESLATLLASGPAMLSLRLGRVDVRFHPPWSLRAFVNDHVAAAANTATAAGAGAATAPASPDERDRRLRLLRALGYRVLSDINAVSVVMPTALVGTVLLTLRGRGVGCDELLRRVAWLRGRVQAKGGRVAHFGAAPLADVVERAVEVLGSDLVGQRAGPTTPGPGPADASAADDPLAHPTFYAADRLQLSMYRNMTLHLFVHEALVCASLHTRVRPAAGVHDEAAAAAADPDLDPDPGAMPAGQLQAQLRFLSSLLRREFIFAAGGLDVNLDQTLSGLEHDGVVVLRRTGDDAVAAVAAVALSRAECVADLENFDFYCFLVWPFIESSWLACVSLMGLGPLPPPTPAPTAQPAHDQQPPADDDDGWLDTSTVQSSAQLVGKTLYHQGDLAFLEAVSTETLRNAYARFEEQGIVQTPRPRQPGPARLRLAPAWRPLRDAGGALVPAGPLWELATRIAHYRRDGAAGGARVLRLVDAVGAKLLRDTATAAAERARL